MTNATETNTSLVNGVDRDKLFGTINLIKGTPELARFKFRVSNEWLDGAHNRSTIETYFGAGMERKHAVKFELNADEPDILLGKDQGAGAGEYLLHALAACLTGTMVYHAAARGIAIEEVESSIEGDVDLRGFLGLDETVRNGFQAIVVNFKIKADVPDEQLQELCRMARGYSPIFDSIANGVPIRVAATRME